MIRPGLLSITFRELSAQRIVGLAAAVGLAGIEWGGDIHVPPGDTAAAAKVRTLTADAGLLVSAYGSYYKPGGEGCPDITAVLDSCDALGAATLRVWAGAQGSADMSDAQRDGVTADLCRVATLGQERGIVVGLEYHGNTLTDSLDSTQRLLREMAHPNVRLFWQPPVGMPVEQAIAELTQVKPAVDNLHVFHWTMDDGRIVRHPLARGEAAWMKYLAAADALPEDRFASLEFVGDDSVERFQEDAATLLRWLERLG